jgi:hypothetical protein
MGPGFFGRLAGRVLGRGREAVSAAWIGDGATLGLQEGLDGLVGGVEWIEVAIAGSGKGAANGLRPWPFPSDGEAEGEEAEEEVVERARLRVREDKEDWRSDAKRSPIVCAARLADEVFGAAGKDWKTDEAEGFLVPPATALAKGFGLLKSINTGAARSTD